VGKCAILGDFVLEVLLSYLKCAMLGGARQRRRPGHVSGLRGGVWSSERGGGRRAGRIDRACVRTRASWVPKEENSDE
jgi:hypothetical protein